VVRGKDEKGTDKKELQTAVREVLVHEIGHYFGLSEEELKS